MKIGNNQITCTINYSDPNEFNPIAEIFDRRGSDRGSLKFCDYGYPWEPYSFHEIYFRYLSHARLSIKSILDIGSLTRKSSDDFEEILYKIHIANLYSWCDYFTLANVTGIHYLSDNSYICPQIFNGNFTHIHQITSTGQLLGHFDIIILSGRHDVCELKPTFDLVKPYVSPRTLLFIENIESLNYLNELMPSVNDALRWEFIDMSNARSTRHPNKIAIIRSSQF